MTQKRIRKNIIMDEYYLLTDKLEEIQWALEGKCDDIDCDKFMYIDLLKKRYKPVLKHNFSCLPSLKREKGAVMRLLSMKRFRRFRYNKCKGCKRQLDKLSDKSVIVSFTRPSQVKDYKGYTEWNGYYVHGKCKKIVKTPEGWKNGF